MLLLFFCDFPYLKIGQGRRYGDVLSDSIYIQGLQLSGEIPFKAFVRLSMEAADCSHE